MADRRVVTASRGLTERAACRRLASLAKRVPADRAIVELGAYEGRTTGWLALGAAAGHRAHITSIDPWDTLDPGTVDAGYQALGDPGYGNGNYGAAFDGWMTQATAARLWPAVTPLLARSEDMAAHWVQPIGLLFHDALHTYEAVRADLEAWTPHIPPRGWVALHDACHPDFGVMDAASDVLDNADWDWQGRVVMRWAKRPDRRGLLVVRRR